MTDHKYTKLRTLILRRLEEDYGVNNSLSFKAVRFFYYRDVYGKDVGSTKN